MKIKLFLIASIMFFSHVTICSEPKSMWDRISSYWYGTKKIEKAPYETAKEKQEKEARRVFGQRYADNIAVGAGVAGAGLITVPTVVKLLDKLVMNVIPREVMNRRGGPIVMSVTVGLIFTYVYLIYQITGIITSEGNRLEKVRKIKENLEEFLADRLLYPTYMSKIHALNKKEEAEFLQYIGLFIQDTEDLLDQACSELVKELNANYRLVSQELKAKDQLIDRYLSALKSGIASVSLEDQIAVLERTQEQQKSIPAMRAYLSLYYRLKNQLEVEKILTPEQKQQLYGWKLQTQEAVSKLSPEELKAREDAWKKEMQKIKEIQESYKTIPKKQLIEEAKQQQRAYEAQSRQ